MFGVIRLIFGGIVFAVCILLIRKSRAIYKRRLYLGSFAIAVALTTLLALVPIENAFVTFSSPEAAFEYVNTGKAKLAVEGDKTAFVIGEKGDADIYSIIPKSNDGWKLGMGFDTKKVNQKISNGITIYVYRYQKSDDYYITVLNTNGGDFEVTDNHNSRFCYLDEMNPTLHKTFYTYYAYIQNMDDQYRLTVNGKEILLTEK